METPKIPRDVKIANYKNEEGMLSFSSKKRQIGFLVFRFSPMLFSHAIKSNLSDEKTGVDLGSKETLLHMGQETMSLLFQNILGCITCIEDIYFNIEISFTSGEVDFIFKIFGDSDSDLLRKKAFLEDKFHNFLIMGVLFQLKDKRLVNTFFKFLDKNDISDMFIEKTQDKRVLHLRNSNNDEDISSYHMFIRFNKKPNNLTDRQVLLLLHSLMVIGIKGTLLVWIEPGKNNRIISQFFLHFYSDNQKINEQTKPIYEQSNILKFCSIYEPTVFTVRELIWRNIIEEDDDRVFNSTLLEENIISSLFIQNYRKILPTNALDKVNPPNLSTSNSVSSSSASSSASSIAKTELNEIDSWLANELNEYQDIETDFGANEYFEQNPKPSMEPLNFLDADLYIPEVPTMQKGQANQPTQGFNQPYSQNANVTISKPLNLNPPGKPAHLNPPGKPAHLNPPSKPAHLNPPGKPAHLNPPGKPAHLNPPGKPAHLNPPSKPVHLNTPGNPLINKQADPININPPISPNLTGDTKDAVKKETELKINEKIIGTNASISSAALSDYLKYSSDFDEKFPVKSNHTDPVEIPAKKTESKSKSKKISEEIISNLEVSSPSKKRPWGSEVIDKMIERGYLCHEISDCGYEVPALKWHLYFLENDDIKGLIQFIWNMRDLIDKLVIVFRNRNLFNKYYQQSGLQKYPFIYPIIFENFKEEVFDDSKTKKKALSPELISKFN